MNVLDAIEARVSRRVFLPTPIEPDKAERLMEMMVEINRERGLTFRYIENGGAAFEGLSRSYGMFRGVRAVLALAGKPDDPDLLEKCGYYGERIVLEATALGLGTCWVAGTFDRTHPELGVPDGDELACVIPVGYVPESKALRERIIHGLTHRKAADAGDEGFEVDGLGEAPAELRDAIRAGVKAVTKAPSAKNGKPIAIEWREGALRLTVPDTYRMQWVDLGIAKYHFELAAGGSFPRGNGAAWEPEGSAI